MTTTTHSHKVWTDEGGHVATVARIGDQLLGQLADVGRDPL
jgi:hypothetical protein